MEWSHDFCLNCDRQISSMDNGAYCSQACRLADVEQSSCSSSSSSPTPGASWPSTAAPSNAFALPPALNFQPYYSRTPSSSASSPTSRSPISSAHNHHGAPWPSSGGERRGQLYSSPSRTSLSSIHSYSHPADSSSNLSDKVKNELREYAGSFDHIRDWKRRMTVV